MTKCPCGVPVDGATLCRKCAAETLGYALANIAAHHGDLDTMRARARAVRYDLPRGKGGTREMPLPIAAGFADTLGTDARQPRTTGTELAWETQNTVTTWARVVAEHHPTAAPAWLTGSGSTTRGSGPRDGGPSPQNGTQPLTAVRQVSACCAWLLRMADRIRVADYGPELLDEILDLERRLTRYVDIPPDLWFAGPCTAGLTGLEARWLCGVDLYAPTGAAVVTCPECGSTYPAADRRDWFLAAAEDRWETASVIARAVTVWTDYDRGESRLVRRIGDWRRQDRLEVRGMMLELGRERPTYRVGDVLDLVAEDARRGEKRGA